MQNIFSYLICASKVNTNKQINTLRIFILLLASLILFSGCVGQNTVTKKQENIATQCVVQGEILNVSTMPSPAESDYPDCNYTAEIKGEWLLEGSGISRSFIAVFPGFRDYKTVGPVYKKGDKLLLTLCPQEIVSEAERVIQIADENENFNLQYFYVQKSELLKQFSEPLTPIQFADTTEDYYSVPTNSPLPWKARRVRRRQINARLKFVNQEIQRMQKEFPQYAKNFQEKFSLLSEKTEIINANKKYMLWRGDSFFSINQGYSIPKRWPEISYSNISLPSIVALDRFCKSQNIDFVLVIVPEMHEVAIDIFLPEMRGYRNPNRLLFCQALLADDVDVIDTTDALIAGRLNHIMMFRYNTMDYHPYDGTNWEAASLVAAQIEERGYLNKTLAESDFQINYGMVDSAYTRKHNAFPDDFNGRFDAGSLINAKRVIRRTKQSPQKEIIVLSNSFNTTPWGNSTFSEYLEYLCKSPVLAVFSQNSTRGIPVKFLNLGKSKLTGIKTCVMYLCENHFETPIVNLDLLINHTQTISKDLSLEVAFSSTVRPNHYIADAIIPIPEEARGRLKGMNIYWKRIFPYVMGNCTGKEIQTFYFSPSMSPSTAIICNPKKDLSEITLHLDIESSTPWKNVTIEKIEFYLE